MHHMPKTFDTRHTNLITVGKALAATNVTTELAFFERTYSKPV